MNGAKGYKDAGTKHTWKNPAYVLCGRLGIWTKTGRDKWEEIKAGCLSKKYARCDEMPTEVLDELVRIGVPEPHAREVLADSGHALQDFERSYARLARSEITPVQFAAEINARITEFVRKSLSKLGADLRKEVFGAMPESGFVVVEPSICTDVYADGAPLDG